MTLIDFELTKSKVDDMGVTFLINFVNSFL